MRLHYTIVSLCYLLFCPLASAEDASEIKVGAAREVDGILIHEVRSPYQSGVTTIRVLRPQRLVASNPVRVVYLLPVEAADGSRFGDAMVEAKRLDLANKHGVIVVAPSFSHLPWYADHPTNKQMRQETYLLKVVLPYIEKHYPVKEGRQGRLLVGFSKSGWGAFSLLLRHPDVFARAAAWDAPMMMDQPGKYGSGDIFGTADNFRQYQITRLLAERGKDLGDGKRLILVGHANFRAEHVKVHALMEKLKIDHVYVEDPPRKHEWGSGWLGEAVELVLAEKEVDKPQQ